MYARSIQDGDGLQSFRRGEYNIPANYRGNAFTADEPPIMESPDIEETSGNRSDTAAAPNMRETAERSDSGESDTLPVSGREHDAPREGLLRSILSRFERGFEFDDLLLIGLILLMLHGGRRDDGKNNDEMILILALLFLVGF